jgi:hypothetical protein
MTILLAIMIVWGKPIALTAEFRHPEACEAAKEQLSKASLAQKFEAFCVTK